MHFSATNQPSLQRHQYCTSLTQMRMPSQVGTLPLPSINQPKVERVSSESKTKVIRIRCLTRKTRIVV